MLKSATQPDCAGGVIWRWYWRGASWALGFLVFYCTKNHLPRPNFESPADKGMSDDGEPNMETGNYIMNNIYIYINYIIHNIYMYVTASHLWQSQLTNGAQVISPPAEACWIAASRTSNSWRQLKLPFKRFWHSEVVKTILAEWGKLRTSWIWVVQSVAYIYIQLYNYIYMYIDTNTQLYTNICRI